MYAALAFALLIVSIVAHEFGHMYFMKKHGIKIQDMGVGFGKSFSFMFYSKRLGIPVYISPILLGAYVTPANGENARINNLPYKAKTEIYGGGVLVNILVFGIFGVMAMICERYDQNIAFNIGYKYLFLFVVVIPVLILIFRKVFFMFLIPIIGFIVLGMISYSIFSFFNPEPYKELAGIVGGKQVEQPSVDNPPQDQYIESQEDTNQAPVGGIIAISRMILKINSLFESFAIVSVLSLSIAAFNTIPISPFDGGKVFDSILRLKSHLFADIWTVTTTFAAIGFMIFVFYSDIIGFK